MQVLQNLDVKEYIQKINKVEFLLEDIKRGLFLFDKNFQESIKKGEKDIKKGMVTICKTEEELDNFFNSI